MLLRINVQMRSVRDWQRAKRIRPYLQGTAEMAWSLGGLPINDSLRDHDVANWAGNSETGTRQGCITQFAGGVVS